MVSSDGTVRRLHRFGTAIFRIVLLSLVLSVLALSTACIPKAPKAEPPTVPLPTRAELEELGPIGIVVAPQSVQETDSRGWFWWQYKPDTTSGIIFSPIGYVFATAMFPLSLPICYMNMGDQENYIRQMAEEMDVQKVLGDAVLKELSQSFAPGFVFSTEGPRAPADGVITTGKARLLLELTGVKLYLDRNPGNGKPGNQWRGGYMLIVESHWSLRAADGGHEKVRFHEVSTRAVFPETHQDIPYEFFLLIDEHARAAVKRLTG